MTWICGPSHVITITITTFFFFFHRIDKNSVLGHNESIFLQWLAISFLLCCQNQQKISSNMTLFSFWTSIVWKSLFPLCVSPYLLFLNYFLYFLLENPNQHFKMWVTVPYMCSYCAQSNISCSTSIILVCNRLLSKLTLDRNLCKTDPCEYALLLSFQEARCLLTSKFLIISWYLLSPYDIYIFIWNVCIQCNFHPLTLSSTV